MFHYSSASKCVDPLNSGKKACPKIRPGPSKGSIKKGRTIKV